MPYKSWSKGFLSYPAHESPACPAGNREGALIRGVKRHRSGHPLIERIRSKRSPIQQAEQAMYRRVTVDMYVDQDALMLEFKDESVADLAAATFSELGYEPYNHGGGRMHIHVRHEDLTSALEIMQYYEGSIAGAVQVHAGPGGDDEPYDHFEAT